MEFDIKPWLWGGIGTPFLIVGWLLVSNPATRSRSIRLVSSFGTALVLCPSVWWPYGELYLVPAWVPILTMLIGTYSIVLGMLCGVAPVLGLTGLIYLVSHWIFPRAAQLGAPPNGGPATQVGNSGVTEGPPSVS